MKALLVGGTPGTGKTEIASSVANHFKATLISIGDLAKKYECLEEHDDDRDTDIINEDCLVEAVIDTLDSLEGSVVIEGHYIDLVPSEYVSDVFILRTHPAKLKNRLLDRGYTKEKVAENIEAEVIGVCQMDALDAFGEDMVIEIDTTELSPKETIKQIIQKASSKSSLTTRIDWMELLESQGQLDEYLKD